MVQFGTVYMLISHSKYKVNVCDVKNVIQNVKQNKSS